MNCSCSGTRGRSTRQRSEAKSRKPITVSGTATKGQEGYQTPLAFGKDGEERENGRGDRSSACSTTSRADAISARCRLLAAGICAGHTVNEFCYCTVEGRANRLPANVDACPYSRTHSKSHSGASRDQ